MTDSSDTPKPKTLDISAFALPKVSVPTSIGQLFVRRALLSDWGLLEGQTPEEIGRSTVRQLTNRIEAQESHDPLGSEDFEQLKEPDFRVVGEALAKLNGWDCLEGGDALPALGACVEKAIGASREQHRRMLADLSESLKSSYSFLSPGTLEKLQGQMGGLANLRSSLAEAELSQSALSALDRIKRADERLATMAVPISPPSIDLRPPLPMDPADTKLGRATLETVRISQEVSQKLNALVDLVAGLNQTVIKDVLPQWVAQVKADQDGALRAFRQAATTLRWTQVAIAISIAVTLGATWWQVEVARGIDRDNSEQQQRIEHLMQQQLEAQRQQTEQYKQESEKLQAALRKSEAARNSPKR